MKLVSWRAHAFRGQESATIAEHAVKQSERLIFHSTIQISKMSIQPLPEDVIAQIKSSTTITSLNGVILELMKNSLDAGSTKVDISVDYRRGGCTVEDNGLGILPSEFSSDGGLGKLYREYFRYQSSSKPNTRQTRPN